MTLLQIFSAVLALSALFAYVNQRFLKLPSIIALMVMGLFLSLVIQVIGMFYPSMLEVAESALERLDFSDFLMDFMLSFLLFAGSLHTDWDKLKASRGPILTFATLGVILSTFFIGSLLYYILNFTTVELPYIYCLLFGALISPTDPIAVLGILKKAKVPESMESKIVGESLFNDGTGVVLFITILHVVNAGIENISPGHIAQILLLEVAGGIGIGIMFGYVVFLFMRRIDHYQTEVLLTLALVMGGYSLAAALHFSGPLSMVTAGLIIGNKGRAMAMSDMTLDYTFKFWEIVDEILNAALFVLIGLELLIIPFEWEYGLVGIGAIFIVLISRFVSIAIPSYAFGFKRHFQTSTLTIMTWGGLRGGISIALALSLPAGESKELILVTTYVVVLFSILVQGLTIEPLIRRILMPGTR